MAIPFNSIKTTLGLRDTLGFGEYLGKELRDLVSHYRGAKYILWAITKPDLLYVNDEVLDLARKNSIPPQEPRIPKDMRRSYFYDGDAHGEMAYYYLSQENDALDMQDVFDDVPF